MTNKAVARGTNLAVSPKYAFMVCAYLRGRRTEEAKRILRAVLEKQEAIPFTRYNDGVGHRRGLKVPGRYPMKACKAVLNLIESAEANAEDQGLAGPYKLVELRANKASSPLKMGRQSRREAKRAHVYVTLEEVADAKKRAPKKQEAKESTTSAASQEQPAKKAPAKKAPAKKSAKKAAKKVVKEEAKAQ